MLGDEAFQLADELGVAAEREVRLDPPLERRESKLVQPPDRRLRERLVGEVGERRPAPERERFAESLSRGRRLGTVRLPQQAGEAVEIELVGLDAQHVAGRPRLEPVRLRAERLPSCETRTWSAVGPDAGGSSPQSSSISRSLETTSFACSSRSASSARWLAPASGSAGAGVGDLQRTEDPELHLVRASLAIA